MGNILTFPDRCDAVYRQEFLQDGDDTLQFDSINDQKQGQKYTFRLPKNFTGLPSQRFKTQDWTNQELAHLYRVKRLLDLAGVSNSIDRGLSDEGDPWFVFCDAADEVFIHLCRIDGVYFLDNPSIETPLRGKDFTQLVDAFLQRKLRGQEESAAGSHKVVRFERNGKVFLHPSTMLAALVWTLFLESDDLVMVLPKDTEKLDDQGENLTGASNDSIQDIPVEMQNLWQASLGLQDEGHVRSTADNTSTYQNFRDMVSASDYKLGQSTYIIGLSAIAISLGMISEKGYLGIDDLTAETVLDLLKNIDRSTDQNSDMLSLFGSDADEALNFITILEKLFVDAAMASTEPTGASTSDGHISAKLLAEHEDLIGFGHISDKISAEMEAGVQEVHSESFAFTKKVENQADTLSGKNSDQMLFSSDSTAPQKLSVYSDLAQFSLMLSKLEGADKGASLSAMSLRSYTIDSNTLYATFDISNADFDKTSSLLTSSASQTYAPKDDSLQNDAVGSLSGEYQAHQKSIMEAYKFVSYLLDKEGNLEIIALKKELIFVDPDVFGVGSSDTYVMSWKMDDGETISVIGLQSDYADFSVFA